ncbi:CLUMA_CG006724, isoform A [Clunio marinus]|uniref:CLUMA_CG006724, isoform A n=1 Tax=Clunio marinus TaxID=568069 RepID=A0A1J1I0S0_9DIPT|nr:CLUMA_CG006724, isoform A [Clunio marinus]
MLLNFVKFFLLTTFASQLDGACDTSNQLLQELTFQLSGSSLQWPCQSTKNIYIHSGRFTPKNVIMTRAQIYRDEAYVTLPRLKAGVPFTLGKISMKRGQCSPAILPFPCWSLQEEGNCQALQSAIDIFLDPNDIMWVLDVGLVNTLESPVRRCPPKVIGINIKTGRVVKSIDLDNVVVRSSRLQYLVAEYDENGNCFIYVADAGSRAILVLDVQKNKNFRVVLPGACGSINSSPDVLYIVLLRKTCGTYLYFTYLKSTRLFSIKTEHLRKGAGSGAVVDVGPKPQGLQMVLLGTDNKSGLFLRYKGQSDIYMWDAESCFKAGNFIEVQSGGDCRLSTQVMPGFRRHMWTIESNFQDYIADNLGCMGANVVIHPVIKNKE